MPLQESRALTDTITGWLALLDDLSLDTADRLRGHDAIERASAMLAGHVDALLDLCGLFTLGITAAEPCDLSEIVEEAVAAATESARTKSVALALELDRAGGTITGDRRRLCRAMTGLVATCIARSGPAGLVTVRLERRRSAVGIRIADRAPGFDAAVVTAALRQFYAIGSQQQAMGCMLALRFANEVMRAHQGVLGIFGQRRGEGVVFALHFPVNPVAP